MANVIVTEFRGASPDGRIHSGYGLIRSTELDSTDDAGGDGIELHAATRQVRLLAVNACVVAIGQSSSPPTMPMAEGEIAWVGVDAGDEIVVTAPPG